MLFGTFRRICQEAESTIDLKNTPRSCADLVKPVGGAVVKWPSWQNSIGERMSHAKKTG
jgi:hypothetical protein